MARPKLAGVTVKERAANRKAAKAAKEEAAKEQPVEAKVEEKKAPKAPSKKKKKEKKEEKSEEPADEPQAMEEEKKEKPKKAKKKKAAEEPAEVKEEEEKKEADKEKKKRVYKRRTVTRMLIAREFRATGRGKTKTGTKLIATILQPSVVKSAMKRVLDAEHGEGAFRVTSSLARAVTEHMEGLLQTLLERAKTRISEFGRKQLRPINIRNVFSEWDNDHVWDHVPVYNTALKMLDVTELDKDGEPVYDEEGVPVYQTVARPLRVREEE